MFSVHNRRRDTLAVGPAVDYTTTPDYVEASSYTEINLEPPSSPSWDALSAINDEPDAVNATQTGSLPCPTQDTGRVICGIPYYSPPPSTSSPGTGSSTNGSRSTSATYTTDLTTPSTTPSSKPKTTYSQSGKKLYTGKYLGLDPSLDMDDFEEIDLNPLPFEHVGLDSEEEEEEQVDSLELRIANLAFEAEEYEDADLGLGALEYYLDEGDEGLPYEDGDIADDAVTSRVEDEEEEEEVLFDADGECRVIEEEKPEAEMTSVHSVGAEMFALGRKMKGGLDSVRG